MEKYFQILGLNFSATTDEIKSTYRKLAKQYHPDVNKNLDASEKFKLATEAYSALIEYKRTIENNQQKGMWVNGFRVNYSTNNNYSWYTVVVTY